MEGQKRSLDLSAIGAPEEEGGEVGEVHWLPCAIEHDGEAKIDAYFRSSMTSRSAPSQGEPEGETKEAYLRGRHLKGAELPLPKGYCAVLLEKEESPADNSATWRAASHVPSLTYWNHTTIPSESDAQRRALEVLDISSAVM